MNRSFWGWIVGILAVIIVLFFGFKWWQGYIGGSSQEQTQQMVATSTATTSTPPAPTGTAVSVTPKSTNTVAQIVAGLPDASKFQALWTGSGVAAKVTGRGPFTIFVPIDEAFGYLPPGALLNLTPAEKLRLIEYHIVKGRALDIGAVESGTIMALSGDALNFNVNISAHTAQVNSSWAVQEFQGRNGVVYTIGQVLLPPAKTQ